MKELNFEQMEEKQGGGFFVGCATAMYTATTTGLVAYASFFGPWGSAAALIGSCVAGGVVAEVYAS